MALLKPLYMAAAEGDPPIPYTAQMDRAGLLSSVFSREGVLNKDGGQLRVTQRGLGAAMSVDVAAGWCAIAGDDISDQGTYVCVSTTTQSLDIPAPPASGSRQHRVVAQVRDKLSNGSWEVYDWTPVLVADTGTGLRPEPPSAITLAIVTVPANALAITNAMIGDERKRSSVGTPWQTGSWLAAGVHENYGGRDPSRPLSWVRTPDGWVFLSGWFRRSGPTNSLVANTVYYLDGQPASGGSPQPVLPPDARPTGIRDFIGLTSNGFVHYAVWPSGRISFRFNYNTQLVQNQTWFSFDNCSFRANSFG